MWATIKQKVLFSTWIVAAFYFVKANHYGLLKASTPQNHILVVITGEYRGPGIETHPFLK